MGLIGDMKQALTSGARPKLSILPKVALVYTTRALEYGAAKYARGNYYGPAPAGVTPAERLLGYIDAAQRHLSRVSDNLNRAMGTGGDLAAAAATVDADGGGKFPASSLPDLAHALASLAIGVLCGVNDGLLPEDPGQPWAAAIAEVGLTQKDDPAAERARVAALTRNTIVPKYKIGDSVLVGYDGNLHTCAIVDVSARDGSFVYVVYIYSERLEYTEQELH